MSRSLIDTEVGWKRLQQALLNSRYMRTLGWLAPRKGPLPYHPYHAALDG